MTKKKIKSKAKRKEIKLISNVSYLERYSIDPTVLIYFILMLVGVLFMLNAGLAYVDFAMDRDEGTYLNMGQILKEGGIMYQDAYGMKPPAVFYTYAIINTLFGYSGEGLRWSLLLANGLAACSLFLFFNRWKMPVAGCLSGIAYSFFAFNPFVFGFAGVIEPYQNLILLFSILALQQGILKEKWIWLAFGGGLATYNVLFKQNLIFAYSALFICLCFYYLFSQKNRNWKPLLYFIGGSFFMSILVFLPVLFQGSLADWYYWNLEFSSKYTSAIPWDKGQEYLKTYLKFTSGFNAWMWVTGALGILLSLILTQRMSTRILAPLLFISCVLALFPGFRFYPHYWIYLSPMLAAGCGLSFYYLSKYVLQQKLNLSPLPADLLVICLFVAGCLYTISNNTQFIDDPKELFINRRLYGDNPFTESRHLGEYLKKQMKPGDELMVLGSEPQVYTFADRTCPTNILFFDALHKPHARKDEMLKDFKTWAETEQPEFIYFSNHPFSWGMSLSSDQQIYQWAIQFIQRDYTTIGVADILPNQAPKISYGALAANYQVQSQKWVKIYKRK